MLQNIKLLEGLTSDETKTTEGLIMFYFGKWLRHENHGYGKAEVWDFPIQRDYVLYYMAFCFALPLLNYCTKNFYWKAVIA